MIDKDYINYITNKNNCPNKEVKILFHGTTINSVTGILSTKFRKANEHVLGEGVYFTDILDYAWYYAGQSSNRQNFYRIPEIRNKLLFWGHWIREAEYV